MNIRLKDVIDLEYLIHVDEDRDSQKDIQTLTARDRKIYDQCKSSSHSRKELLFSWLSFRRKAFAKEKTDGFDLPGECFLKLYCFMAYVMVILGGFSGVITAYSFLTYHGSRPINVALFMVMFVGFQVALMLVLPLLKLLRGAGPTIIHTMITGFCFAVLPKILSKVRFLPLKNSLDTAEYTYTFIRGKNREYNGVFFWPLFVLTSVFALSFSSGVLGATFFKILISDLAFGWQSTIVSASGTVYDVVSVLALPWSWFMPQDFSHPTLEQIEGSRIVLKDGIQVLSTQDLVSWWPFICMGLLVYTVIPRLLFILAGVWMEQRVLKKMDFEHPRFSQLIIRMQSPVLNIDEKQSEQAEEVSDNVSGNIEKEPALKKHEVNADYLKAALFFSKTVYNDTAAQKVTQYLKNQMCIDVEHVHNIDFDFENDERKIIRMGPTGQAVVLYEIWQPPIRGVLHYLKQFREKLPGKVPLIVLLTGDAGREDLSVKRDDINLEVWEKAVFKLGDPGINVKRMAM